MPVMTRLRWQLGLLAGALALTAGVPRSAPAQQVDVEEYVLDNGFRLLMVPRAGDPNVAAGWVARVGSVNERPGLTGVSHLFEHMMFKGTRVIGTRDIERELALMQRLDEVRAGLRQEEQALTQRARLGEVDPAEPAARTPRHVELLAELDTLQQQHDELIVDNEFDRIYTAAGASGMNAGTNQDFTVYFINVPSNKLELWFWMESDRLLSPVFREFYAERDVVAEERRLRIDSTPIGRIEEQFDAMFWTASPYGWPVIGWPSDIARITREEALQYFAVNYAPNNLTACLVGDFDPVEARALADRYFGRLERNPELPDPVRTFEPEPLAERRLVAYADTTPSTTVRYLTVPDGHEDEAPLLVLASLLNGRTGRLYRSLVLEESVATGAGAFQNGLKWQGYFALGATAQPGRAPEELVASLEHQVERLQVEPVDDRELQKVKNQYSADLFRRIESSFALMFQLLAADSSRGWQSFNDDPEKVAAVTPDDVQRVARTYLTPERRAVVLYHREEEEAETSSSPPQQP